METSTTFPNQNAIGPLSFRVQIFLTKLNHALIVIIGVCITKIASDLEFQDTAKHMFLTVMGFHVLIAEAVMSHHPPNHLTNRFSYRNKSRYHGVLQLIGGSLVLRGAWDKIQNTDSHFNTWHGIVGIFATFMCFASLVGGILNFFQPKFALKIYPAPELKYRHNLFGILTFSLGMATIVLGYFTKFFTKHVDADIIRAFYWITTMVYLICIIAPVRSLFYKLQFRRNRLRH